MDIDIKRYENFDGGIAQSVERRNHNPCVVGSNPSPATNLALSFFSEPFLYLLLFLFAMFCLFTIYFVKRSVYGTATTN